MDHPSANRGPITPPAAGGGRTDDWLTALARLPWQRLLIWAVFLVALYTVRHFFFVIFTTFLLSYCIRSVVVPLADRLAPGRQGPWLERWLTLALFVVLVAGVAGVGFVVAPRFIDQSRSVIERVERVGPHQEFQHFLSRTVGAYQFHSQYGQPGGQRFERAYREYLAAHPQMDSPAAQTQFASLTRDQLAEAWWQGDPVAASLREQAGQELPRLLAGLGLRAQELARDAIAIPVEFVMALALTILITFDMHNLKQRMQSLRQTRIRGFYDEIVPELSTFARLIGRAFRAQAVVAVANTLLTAVVLWFLEIENEALLCGIVFAWHTHRADGAVANERLAGIGLASRRGHHGDPPGRGAGAQPPHRGQPAAPAPGHGAGDLGRRFAFFRGVGPVAGRAGDGVRGAGRHSERGHPRNRRATDLNRTGRAFTDPRTRNRPASGAAAGRQSRPGEEGRRHWDKCRPGCRQPC
jgi:predicted PurR-regulated permease PerM